MRLLISLAFCFAGLNAFAADPAKDKAAMDAKMAEWAKIGSPGDQHKVLKDLEGKWNYTMKWWMSPSAPPEESKGLNTNTMILGGRFLQMEMKGKASGKQPPLQGIALVGFDNVKKEFESVWVDNMSTSQMRTTGTWDPATKTLTETGTYVDPSAGNATKKFRNVTKMTGKNAYTMEMYMTGEDGKEFKSMEVSYTK